ncbi:TetR/AcrR family transcriptional regulator [Microseira wollei]|uniref:Transcriptional Regulator, TetR family protein n=1 Tax=Microseira wollei NIES-4236 TaxID=2530354 RepID=A0AAV3X8X0_9CYAN|nr:TetR/AcrR family transcriptional regulator [Microseira wollei]GET37091.1 transcriptional Regulator, TetR family protein [Microseira wollei NIES-4236]
MPKIVDRDLYRKELLGKCFDLFASKGYASITMREIAQKLGVSTGTLYHYFPSKEAMFVQLFEERYRQTIASIAPELEKAKTLAERIEIVFDFVARNEEYFLKQLLLDIEFYQQQGREKMQKNKALQQLTERALAEFAKLLGIQDPKFVIYISSLIDGLVLARLYTDEIISWSEQGALLGKMITAYLEQQKDYADKTTISRKAQSLNSGE